MTDQPYPDEGQLSELDQHGSDLERLAGVKLSGPDLDLARLRLAGSSLTALGRLLGLKNTEVAQRLRRPDVSAYMSTSKKLNRLGVHLDSDEVLERVLELADVNLADFLEPGGKLVSDLSTLPPSLLAGVSELTESTDLNGTTTRKLKLHSKLEALRLLGRHESIGAWRDRVEVDAGSGFAERMKAARARSASAAVPAQSSPSTSPGADPTDE